MIEQELKEKIVKIIKQNGVYNGKSMRRNYYVVNDEELADALIAAGIGDVKDLQAQVNVLEITNIALQAGYDDAEKDRLYWVDKYKKAEHRAEVAERALDRACEKVFLLSDNCRYSNLKDDVRDSIKLRRSDVENFIAVVREKFLQQAEKELAEEGKDGNETD